MDGSPAMGGAAAEADSNEASPNGSAAWAAPGLSGNMGNMGDVSAELNNIHAANATCAAFHADVAAKHAASLAQWVQYLWGQIGTLQSKVVELEDWKKKTTDDMHRLRVEHKALRKKVAPDGDEDAVGLPGKAKSLPLLLADHVDPGSDPEKKGKKSKASSSSSASSASMRPPPGFEGVETPGVERSKSVRFGKSEEHEVEGQPPEDPASPVGGVLRTISMLSEISHITDAPDEGLLEGVSVAPVVIDGAEGEVAQWRIGHLSTKLRGCMGRALVSSPFEMLGLQDLRLMVFPDGKEVAKGPRSRRQKELYAKKVSEGPLEGCLKLKVPDCRPPHTLRYFLKIGSCRKGPFEHNFAESTVNGCLDFGVDWLTQVEPDHSLTVTVEVLRYGAAEAAANAG